METLAIKYRPQDWASVTEQDNITTILKNQINTNTIKNAYLFCGGAGTGKTTCARIFANEINQGQGSPIELDAASNNGVDDVREIGKKAKTKSIDSVYKIFIIDECVTGDVEILTSNGFKRFDECDGTETVAQYNNGKIEFVKPDSWVKNEYDGDLIKWSPRNWCSIRMTPNHVQPLFYNKSQCVKEKYIKDVKFSQTNNLIVSGSGVGTKSHLTPLDRLAIVCQADATIQAVNKTHTHWSISLSKQRKIDRLLEIFESGDIKYNEIKSSSGKRRFTFDTPLSITKSFDTYFDLDFDYNGARDFINEVTLWDGYITDKYVEYMSTDKQNTDFVSAVACLGGYSARQRVQKDCRKLNYKDVHRVYLYDKTLSNCQHIKKTVNYEHYNGYVYCVKVPSHQIVIRSQGFVFVTGNCHALSNSAWQSMLKLIEEPPAKTIFIFCTTDPQKIPKTILSRVQRYDFKRISKQGIVDRLEYILTNEHLLTSSGDPQLDGDTFIDVAKGLEYIARLSDGGMRDAITMLDKCISYNEDITLESVLSALNLQSQDTMVELTKLILDGDETLLNLLDDIYMSGTDIKQFTRDYLNFVFDVKKSIILGDIDKTHLVYTDELKALLKKAGNKKLDTLLNRLIKLVSEIKFDMYPKYLIEYTLLEVANWKN